MEVRPLYQRRANVAFSYTYLKLIFSRKTKLLGTYYKAPHVDEADKISSTVSGLSLSYVIIIGDFNEDLLMHQDGNC